MCGRENERERKDQKERKRERDKESVNESKENIIYNIYTKIYIYIYKYEYNMLCKYKCGEYEKISLCVEKRLELSPRGASSKWRAETKKLW